MVVSLQIFVVSCGCLIGQLLLSAEKSSHELSTIDQLQRIIGACSNYLSDLLKDCIEAIHLLENKTSSVRRLVYTKLAFCLEQMLSFAGMVHKMKLHQEECFINVSIFIRCTKSVQLALVDPNIQVLKCLLYHICIITSIDLYNDIDELSFIGSSYRVASAEEHDSENK